MGMYRNRLISGRGEPYAAGHSFALRVDGTQWGE